ncbi:hypothetical protein LQ567_19315 [Niabella pedocola]|uniref:Bacterial EndoU nuclease domain-containing protein n=1 Tax=Niabella pedocola TaxID=1752077 RepID=A0ABS8PV34_9BACT|nr:hypothetical protein [Niabella pedocola]MCD2424942.1 hypothetical protein [Niabella pedocola]
MHAVTTPTQNTHTFNEEQWLPVLFLLADTQTWLQQLQEGHLRQLPVKNRKKLLRKSWYLGVKALAHILERHYHKVARHPLAGKFTIPIPAIVAAIKDAYQQPAQQLGQSGHWQRVQDMGSTIGYNSRGQPVSTITIITDAAGEIITAFPGAAADR